MEFPFDEAYLRVIRGKAGQVTEVTPEVSNEVDRLLKTLRGDMSRTELMSVLGLKDEKHFRKHYQQTAVALELIEMTLPDKPSSRLQKYRLTAAGRARLQKITGAG
jgi:ATP-dependent DNA helicase RecG